jgi:hypothetical protein
MDALLVSTVSEWSAFLEVVEEQNRIECSQQNHTNSNRIAVLSGVQIKSVA